MANLDRKQFLQLIAAGGMLAGCSREMPIQSENVDESAASARDQADFSSRVEDDIATCFRGALCYIGDSLGIFEAMSGSGPMTVDMLAQETGLNSRYLQEWLAAMTTAEYIEYHPQEDSFSLPPGHAAVLSDGDSPAFQAGRFQILFSLVSAAEGVAESFRSGTPMTGDRYHPDLWKGIERMSAVSFRNALVQQWIPALPAVVQRLQKGGAVLDYSCGNGGAVIEMARAYPATRVVGRDPFGPSIETARIAAAEAGLGGRAVFEQGTQEYLPKGTYDLITIFKSVHHYPNPVEVLSGLREALKPEGAMLIGDFFISENLMENANPMGRLTYGASTLLCLHDSIEGAAIGTGMTERMFRDFARGAGFSTVRRVLDADGFGFWLHELRA